MYTVAIKKEMYSPCSPYKKLSASCTVSSLRPRIWAPHRHSIEGTLVCEDELGWFVVFTNVHFVFDTLVFVLFNGRTRDL